MELLNTEVQGDSSAGRQNPDDVFRLRDVPGVSAPSVTRSTPELTLAVSDRAAAVLRTVANEDERVLLAA
jgi:precorrin-2 methylase